MLRPISLALLLSLLCACGDRNAPPAESAAPSPEAAPAPQAAAPTAPADQPDDTSAPGPISVHAGPAVSEPGKAAAAPAGSIEFDLPKGWQTQEPQSSMRLAQAAIPGPGGPGEFAVFYFGAGGGGSVDANISRWIGQMDTKDQPKPEGFQSAGGLKVTWVDVKGTLKPGQMGMSNTTTAVSNARLYGAVVEGPGGPWFFKATGPDAILGAQRDAFVTMLKSVRAKPASS
jgi:hypothetical protein